MLHLSYYLERRVCDWPNRCTILYSFSLSTKGRNMRLDQLTRMTRMTRNSLRMTRVILNRPKKPSVSLRLKKRMDRSSLTVCQPCSEYLEPSTDKPFPQLLNDLILRAARGQPCEQVPVWCHRQAGRYLQEFRAMRVQADFFKICQTPELAAEVTLQPIRRFALDAAIIFSDILVVPQALGMEVQMQPGKGPVLPEPLRKPEDIDKLIQLNPDEVRDRLKYVLEAIALTRHSLRGVVPLIGFSGAPWTLMAYMVEGGGAKSYDNARSWLYRWPEAAHKLLRILTDTISEYLIGQVKYGAQMLEIFDSWAGDLSPELFAEFSLPYLLEIAMRVKESQRKNGQKPVPMTLFPKGAHYVLPMLDDTEYDVVSLDWTFKRAVSRSTLNTQQRPLSIQGNLDPAVLFAGEDVIRAEVRKMIDGFGTQRYIANLGHGMLPTHDPQALAIFVDEIHLYSRAQNA